MPDSNYQFPVFVALRDQGYPALNDMVTQQIEETLHLEFKTLSDQTGSSLLKEDRKLIAKAVCGFSNAEGGVLLLGVRTTKSHGIDVALGLVDFENVEAMRNRIVSAIPDLLSPQNAKIEVIGISSPSTPSKGLIAINVPPSDARPHMSIVHHHYFRRGSDGTRMLEHGEIKELMLAPREGRLGLGYRMISGMMSGDLKYKFDCMLSLRNEGKIAVRAPFIRVTNASITPADVAFRAQAHPKGGRVIYGTGDIIVHAEDELDIAKIETGLHVHKNEGGAKIAISRILEQKDDTAFSIRTWSESQTASQPYDRLISTSVFFGGENVAIQSHELHLDKWGIFLLMANNILAR
jgi:Putative DNA-binding domain